MNREEAIAELSVLHERLSNPKDCEDGCYSWEDGLYVEAIDMAIEALSADAVPIHEDGTLEVKVPNAQKVGRVLVMDTESHIGGGLFYPDDAVHGEWIWRTDIPIGDGRTSAGYICSNCGKDYWHGNVLDVCPNCGARMTPYKGGDTE